MNREIEKFYLDGIDSNVLTDDFIREALVTGIVCPYHVKEVADITSQKLQGFLLCFPIGLHPHFYNFLR